MEDGTPALEPGGGPATKRAMRPWLTNRFMDSEVQFPFVAKSRLEKVSQKENTPMAGGGLRGESTGKSVGRDCFRCNWNDRVHVSKARSLNCWAHGAGDLKSLNCEMWAPPFVLP